MSKTFKNYLIGMICSAGLILLAFVPVYMHVTSNRFSSSTLIWLIMSLAIVQALVQLKYFLHLDFKPDSGWNIGILISTIGIILLVVVGSIWIMNHLNYNMTPDQMNQYIDGQDGL